jgi:hypothetical protein
MHSQWLTNGPERSMFKDRKSLEDRSDGGGYARRNSRGNSDSPVPENSPGMRCDAEVVQDGRAVVVGPKYDVHRRGMVHGGRYVVFMPWIQVPKDVPPSRNKRRAVRVERAGVAGAADDGAEGKSYLPALRLQNGRDFARGLLT